MRQRSHHLNEALNHHGETVVQSVGDGIHIVGKITHHVALFLRVKKSAGQCLQMGEQVAADIVTAPSAPL